MLSHLRYYLTGLYRELWVKPIFLWAQAIAFKVLITIVPAILLVSGILGQVLRQEKPMAYVQGVVRDLVPSFWSGELNEFLSTLQGTGGRLTLIGAVGIVVTTVTLFTTLRTVLGHVFSEDWHEQRTPIRGYLFDFQMAAQTGVLLLVSIGLTVFLQTAGSFGLSRVGMADTWLQQLSTEIGQAILLILPVLVSLVMFFQLYWFIPKPRPPKKAAIVGAMTAALLWEIAKIGVTYYASRFGFENGWQSALGDTFLLIILLVLWAYYSALVLNIGALTALLYERRQRLFPPEIQDESLLADSTSEEILVNVGNQ